LPARSSGCKFASNISINFLLAAYNACFPRPVQKKILQQLSCRIFFYHHETRSYTDVIFKLVKSVPAYRQAGLPKTNPQMLFIEFQPAHIALK
jgi:hypothetical protein